MEVWLGRSLHGLVDGCGSDMRSSVWDIAQLVTRGSALHSRSRLRNTRKVLNVTQGFARPAHAEHASWLGHGEVGSALRKWGCVVDMVQKQCDEMLMVLY